MNTSTDFPITGADRGEPVTKPLSPGYPGRQSPADGSGRAAQQALLFAFLLGLGARLQIQIIGYLPLSEIAIVLLFPFLTPLYRNSSLRARSGWLLPLLFLWMIGAVASDFYRETEWSLAARGVARIVIYITAIPFFTWFLHRDMYGKLLYFTAGTIPSAILSAFVLRGGVHEGRELVYGRAEISWKTHWAFVLFLAAALAALYFYRRSRLIAYITNAICGAVNLALGSRSTGAFNLIAVIACITKNGILANRRGRPPRARLVRSLAVGTLIAVAAVGLLQGYSWLAEAGHFGGYEQAKYRAEARHQLGVLGGGRLGQFVGGLIAVSESPIIGYGSWPLDKYGFYYQVCEFFEQRPDPSFYSRGYPLIPSHSHIVSAWVEHGILGVPFWIYAMFLAIRAILLPIGDSQRLQLWVMSTAVAMIWNVLFSPISYRMETSMTLVVFISQYLEWRRALAAMPALNSFTALSPTANTHSSTAA